MKIQLFFLIVLCWNCELFAQSRMILNDDVYVVIENAALIVLDNPNSNALNTTGSGGNIISENEFDAIKWNVGSSTGVYVIPWTTTPFIQGGNDVKIPQVIEVTVGGVGSGNMVFSTYETATDLNTVYPVLVTSMNSANSGGMDGSLFAVDRFWHTNANSYLTRPSVVMTINYDPAANEIGGMNTIVESNLLAQRWSSTTNDWEAILFGVNDATNSRVTNINVPAADFFENWTLVDQVNILPVELGEFKVECDGVNSLLSWFTIAEVNNAYFEIEKSYDAINYFSIGTIDGAGSTNEIQDYSYVDRDLNISYYRLTQVDFNGIRKVYNAITSNCGNELDEVSAFFYGDQLLINSEEGTIANLLLYDNRGRLIWNIKDVLLHDGFNTIQIESHLGAGMYFLQLMTKKTTQALRLMKLN
ncbi:MAG: T9SS type A sorting domain-containing protein [Crocinitomicaceae bacterium]|nr:T9SS type A sorting domain-containing protein [Flavobacteriales bacterium]NQZ37613.1 T9SS type A sorting domain-containing protein [Crocinitomicaceae bacterium]